MLIIIIVYYYLWLMIIIFGYPLLITIIKPIKPIFVGGYPPHLWLEELCSLEAAVGVWTLEIEHVPVLGE